MKYSEYKDKIKSGDLLVWGSTSSGQQTGLLTKIIRLMTMSEYSHVGIAYVDTGRPLVFEAVIPHVRLYPLRINEPFYHIPIDVNWNDGSLNFLLSKVGQEYSVLDAIRGYFGKPNVDNKWQCVELADAFYKNSGMDFGDVYTPSTLVEAVLSQRDTSITLIDKP